MTNKNIGEGILEYNSAREHLTLPEYGRNIQKLVEHAKQIADPVQRQEYVETLIELMNQMLPGTKSAKEIEDKLWNHLFFIANYELDVQVPETVTIHKKGDVFMIPSPDVEYPQKKIPYRHYGYNVHTMVQKVLSMEPGPKRDEFSKIIASYMKLAYRNWGKEQFVNDELIKEDLRKMSHGQIDVSDDANIDSYKNVITTPVNSQQRRKNFKGQGGQQQGQHNRRFQQNRPQQGGKKKKRY
jgi:hypothetical protein